MISTGQVTTAGEYQATPTKAASGKKDALGVSTAEASASTDAEAPMESENRDPEAAGGGDGDGWMHRNARLDDQIAVGPGSCLLEGQTSF